MYLIRRMRIVWLILLAWTGGTLFSDHMIGWGQAAPAIPGTLEEKEGAFVAQEDGNVLMRYLWRAVPFKPYVQELRTPAGLLVLLDAPADHPHHHGLMFAVGAEEVDFWTESENCGKQKTRTIEAHLPCPLDILKFYRLRTELIWSSSQESDPLLEEERTIEVAAWQKQEATLLNWRSVLSVPESGKAIHLFGSHYFGLGMRFVPSMDKTGTFLNSSGKPGEIVRGDEHNVPANWCAYQASIEGKPVTVAMFAFPKNQRHPAVWFTMKEAFAYLSATLNLYKEPLELQPDKKLDLQYGVVLWDGTIPEERIEKAYREWLQMIEKRTGQ